MSERKRKRDGKNVRGSERERQGERESVCVGARVREGGRDGRRERGRAYSCTYMMSLYMQYANTRRLMHTSKAS